MNARLTDRFTRVDIAALLAFAAVWAYYIVMVGRGFFFADEGLYYTIAQRFVNGDRPLVDEWHIIQLACLFLCLPYKAYVALTGSAAGVALFMRYLFLAFNAAFYWFMYIRLRAYRWLSLIASLLFAVNVPFLIYVCNYYTVASRLLMVVCLILFADRQKPLSLWIAGALLSCAVLCQPGFAFLYFVFSVLVFARFLRQKKGRPFLDDYAFCLNVRTWKHLSVSVFVCAAVFLCWLFARSGLRNILTSVPYLFTDPEYDFSANGHGFLHKLADAVRIYGLVCLIPALLTLIGSAAYACGAFRARRDTARKLLFGLACAVWICSCVTPFRIPFEEIPNPYSSMFQTPLFWFGLACYLLCEHKSKRFLFFWTVGLLASLSTDCFSDVALSLGLPIAYIADLVFFADLVRELRAEEPAQRILNLRQLQSRKKAKRADLCVRWLVRLTCFCFALWFGFVLFFLENASRSELTGAPFFSLTHRIEKGPCRSLYFDETYGKSYDDKLSDIDTLRKKQPKNLLVFGLNTELYVYAQLPYAACSSYTWADDAYLQRHMQYWRLHPERLPDCVYVPIDDLYNNNHGDLSQAASWVRETFDPLCAYTMQTGKSGYILYVSRWYPDTETAAQK